MKLPGNNLRSYKYLLVIFIFGMIVFPDLAISKIDNTKEPMLLIADEIHFDEKLGIIAAKGNVEIAYKKRTLTANQITYNQRDDIVTAIGNIVLVEPTGEVNKAEQVVEQSSQSSNIISDSTISESDSEVEVEEVSIDINNW